MVYHGHEYVLIVGNLEKHCPHWDFAGQIECITRRRADGFVQSAGGPLGCVDDVPAGFGPLGRHDHLLGNPVRGNEQRAQALVTAHHVGECGAERLGVEVPAQSHGRRDVVHR